MPDWKDYKKEAKERGSLALELYVVESTPAKPPEEVKANLADHLSYQRSLEEAGVLAFAGPLSDLTGELMQGAGLIIYRSNSMEEAKKIADADPMHKAAARSYTLRKWLINEGSLSLNVGLSTGKVDFN